MKRALRWVLLGLGLALFGWFLARAGWREVGQALGELGWLAPIPFLPYALVYALDTVAWSYAFYVRPRVSWKRLYRIRWSGESVNNVIPTAYVGGEALKVYLLRKSGVRLRDAASAAIVSKSTQTLAQLLFVALAAGAFVIVAPSEGPLHRGMLFVVIVSVLLVSILFWLQRAGFFKTLMDHMGRTGLRIQALERQREHLLLLDNQIKGFYRKHRGRFFLSVGFYLSGWLLDPAEIFLAAWLMGIEITWFQALAVEAFIGVAKVMGLFVPGAIGVQESGIVLLCRWAGLPDAFGFAYAILRRGRELVYASIGWILLYSEELSIATLRDQVKQVREDSEFL